MVKNQISARGIRDVCLTHAMSSIPREIFVRQDFVNEAYSDMAVPTKGYEGQTVSQPFMIAYMVELLGLTGKEKVLEIGTGSGYQTAILSHCAEKVVSLEISPKLAQLAYNNIAHLGRKNVTIVNADGKHGYSKEAPYDRIIVGAYADKIPTTLLDQLKDDGIMVIPIGGDRVQQVNTVTKRDDVGHTIRRRKRHACRFVPLS